jgi:hypothetical protein
MLVPKAAMYEDGDPTAAEYEIGFAGQILHP